VKRKRTKRQVTTAVLRRALRRACALALDAGAAVADLDPIDEENEEFVATVTRLQKLASARTVQRGSWP
jgi:hypothetical protein